MSSDPITVAIDGRAYTGWKGVSVRRALDQAAGQFELKTTMTRALRVRRGSEVVVKIGRQLVATGFVDGLRASKSATQSELVVYGRDKTQDLVDCSVPEGLDQLTNATVAAIVEALTTPLGIDWADNRAAKLLAGETIDQYVARERFAKFAFNAGETCWTAIQRACRARGALAFTDEQGRLLLEFPGSSRADAIVAEGERNDWEFHWDDSDLFTVYVCLGQRSGSDKGWGDSVAGVRGFALDVGVPRRRTLVLVSDGAVDTSSADAIASWEATVRAARSAGVTAKRQGWRQTAGGRVWKLNQLVPVRLPSIEFEEELLVNEVELTHDDNGRRVRVELIRPDSYSQEPKVDKEGDPFNDWGKPTAGDEEPVDVEDLDLPLGEPEDL